MSGYKKRKVDRPEPLWRPVCEEEEEEAVQGTSSEDSRRCGSKQSHGDASPPSPRTLKAIQAAINDSSDEEIVIQDERDGSVSPRTHLAIQQALAEDEEEAVGSKTLIGGSPTKLCANTHRHVPQVVINSSEEETEPEDTKSLPNGQSDVRRNITSQSLPLKEPLFVDSSEDEMEEMIGQRNKALCFDRGEQLLRIESEHLVQSQSAPASSPNTLSISLSAEGHTEHHHLVPEQTSNKSLDVLKQRHGDAVKPESSEESEAEGTVTSQR